MSDQFDRKNMSELSSAEINQRVEREVLALSNEKSSWRTAALHHISSLSEHMSSPTSELLEGLTPLSYLHQDLPADSSPNERSLATEVLAHFPDEQLVSESFVNRLAMAPADTELVLALESGYLPLSGQLARAVGKKILEIYMSDAYDSDVCGLTPADIGVILLACASADSNFRKSLEELIISDNGTDVVELIGTSGELHAEAANIFNTGEYSSFSQLNHPEVRSIDQNIDTDGFDMRSALAALADEMKPSTTEQVRLILVHKWLVYCQRASLRSLPPVPRPDEDIE